MASVKKPGLGKDLTRVGPYVIGNTLGAGITGKVKLAFDKDTGEQVAVKIISRDLVVQKPSMGPKLEREIGIMKLMDHPNVLHMFDVCETSENLYMVLEFAQNGELFDFLVRRGALDDNAALEIFQQIIEGVDYCHKHFVCHRDLKPENILLDADNNIKIADFGMSGIRSPDSLFETSCGSPHYASPEVVSGISYDGEKADIWSCGVILYALVSGKLPFDNENIRILLGKVKTGVYVMPPFLHRDVKDLISRMLVVDPDKRISMDEIREHPWYTTNPPKSQPTKPLTKCDTIIEEENIDDDIIRSLTALNFGKKEELIKKLTSDESNIIKRFYQLYEARKNEPRALERKQKRLDRAKSELGMRKKIVGPRPADQPKVESQLKQSTNVTLSKKKKLTRRLSYNFNTSSLLSGSKHSHTNTQNTEEGGGKALVRRTSSKQFSRIKLEPKQEKNEKPEKCEKGEKSTSPRKSWLPTWFGTSDLNLKKEKRKNLKEGVESDKSIGQLTQELEDALETIGASYSFTQKRDRIKARLTKNSKTVKFAITMLNITEDEDSKKNEEADALYWISFSRRSGDKSLYNEIVDNIKNIMKNK